ncbi:MAG: hypothetical protein U5K72_17675 [Balneolaceae bacterium]|nr:hypothetical protein [Balneolaceae bacterium]
MFLMTGTQLPDPYGNEATDIVHPQGMASNEYFTVKVREETDNGEIEHKVNVKFSRVENRENIHGGSELGEIYREMQGVSVVRAGREIAFRLTLGLCTDVSDPKNRWWGV